MNTKILSLGLVSLFVLIFFGAIIEIFIVTPILFNRFLFETIILSLTLQAGHVAFTYFILASDPQLRKRFPWLGFLALNVVLFLSFLSLGRGFSISEQGFVLIGYNFLRIFHDTRQGYGTASLMAADLGAVDPGFFSGLRNFLLPLQTIAISSMVFSNLMGSSPLRVAVGLLCVILSCGLFLRMLWKIIPPGQSWGTSLFPALILGRFTLLGIGGSSLLVRSFLRMLHGLEYSYLFFRFCRQKRWTVFFLALALAVLVQVIWILSKMQQAEILKLPYLRLATVLVHTIVITHIAQDWFIFSYDKVSAERLRGIFRGRGAGAGAAAVITAPKISI